MSNTPPLPKWAQAGREAEVVLHNHSGEVTAVVRTRITRVLKTQVEVEWDRGTQTHRKFAAKNNLQMIQHPKVYTFSTFESPANDMLIGPEDPRLSELFKQADRYQKRAALAQACRNYLKHQTPFNARQLLKDPLESFILLEE